MMKTIYRSAVAALVLLLGAFVGTGDASAQTNCPQSVFGTYGVTPTAGQWWLCINWLQGEVQDPTQGLGLSILKGNGNGGFAAAIAGTDYAAPTTGSSILKGNSAGGFLAAVAGTDYDTPANVASAIGTALPSATSSQLYGGTGAAGAAADVTVGSGLSLSGRTLSATGSGVLSLVSTQTGSGATIAWTGLSSSTYYRYKLYCQNLSSSATNGDTLLIQAGINSGPTWETTAAYYSGSYFGNNTNSTSVVGAASSGSGLLLTNIIETSANTESNMIDADISLTAATTGMLSTMGLMVLGSVVGQDASNYVHLTQFSGGYVGPSATAVTAIRLLLGSGNNLGGTCSLYSVSH